MNPAISLRFFEEYQPFLIPPTAQTPGVFEGFGLSRCAVINKILIPLGVEGWVDIYQIHAGVTNVFPHYVKIIAVVKLVHVSSLR